MNELQPLMGLLQQTERERDEALLHHQGLLTVHQTAQAQSEQLLAYRSDYEKRWGEHFSREGKIELVRCYQGFVERLNQAITQQAQAVEHANAQAGSAATALREQELRVASVRKLIERRVQQAEHGAQQREQKQSDEFASRATWRRLSAFGFLSAG